MIGFHSTFIIADQYYFFVFDKMQKYACQGIFFNNLSFCYNVVINLQLYHLFNSYQTPENKVVLILEIFLRRNILRFLIFCCCSSRLLNLTRCILETWSRSWDSRSFKPIITCSTICFIVLNKNSDLELYRLLRF